MTWSHEEAVALAIVVESVVPKYGAHVALTGGCLYKTGQRKDCDLLFYRIRQAPEIKMEEMWEALHKVGFVKQSGFGWCYKAKFHGKSVDCFFPEEDGGTYQENEFEEHP